jgi:hypothetical protein
MNKKSKRPRDTNKLAKKIVDIATGEDSDEEPEEKSSGKNPNAVALGKLGGSKGGKARAKKLSAARRKEIARKAAKKRWSKRKK